MIYMPKRNNSLNQTPDNQICVTQDSAYLIILDQLKAIELEAEKVQNEARTLQRRLKMIRNKNWFFHTSEIEIMTKDLAERADRVGRLYRTIVQLNKNKEEVTPQYGF
jgi:hypothetical protein